MKVYQKQYPSVQFIMIYFNKIGHYIKIDHYKLDGGSNILSVIDELLNFADIHCYWGYSDDFGTNWRDEEHHYLSQNL